MATNNNPAIRQLTQSIWDIDRRLTGVERTPQLANSSLDDTGINIYDSEGEPAAVLGKQDDGSFGVHIVKGPTPVAPSAITAESGVVSLVVSWDGEFAGYDEAPRDYRHVAIHVSSTPDFEPTAENTRATFTAIEPATRTITVNAGTYYLKATTVSIPGMRSEPTSEIQQIAEKLVDDESIKAEIEQARIEREQAAQEAQEALSELEDKLDNMEWDDSALIEIRETVADAQEAIASAQTTASEAVTAANAASQAALEAAGIAASKGQVLVQEAEPQGDDRKSSNIWIQPVEDDPTTEVEEKAVTYVYLEASDEWVPTTSSELAQAAQNALDAREAAQQAQQRADTAIANAAAATSAAAEAQRTANEATLDARDAHNAAAAAQQGVDAALERGDSLLANGSFEHGHMGWAAPHPRYTVVEDATARSGNHVMRLAPETANAYPASDPISVQPDDVLYVRSWWRRREGGEGDSRASIYVQWLDKTGARIAGGYAGFDGSSTLIPSADMPVDDWVFVDGEVVNDVEGCVAISLAPHATTSATETFDVDDVQVVNVTEVRLAKARADEAYTEAASKATPEQVTAAATAAENAAKAAAAADADLKAAQAKADAISEAAADAQGKADAAQAAAEIAAATDAKAKADQALADALEALATAQGEISEQIISSANGKNAITISPDSPSSSTPGVVAGDIWWRRDGTNQVYGQWTWNGSTWEASTVRNEMLASMDVHKLQVTGTANVNEAVINKLFAETFAAHKITASELSIASVKPDGSLADNSVGAVTIKDGAVNADKITAEAITSDKIASNAITADKIGANEITAEKISGGSFVGETFEGGTFTGAEFKTSDAVDGDVILSDTAFKYLTQGIPGVNIAPGLEIQPPLVGSEIPPGIGTTDTGVGISGGWNTLGVNSAGIPEYSGSMVEINHEGTSIHSDHGGWNYSRLDLGAGGIEARVAEDPEADPNDTSISTLLLDGNRVIIHHVQQKPYKTSEGLTFAADAEDSISIQDGEVRLSSSPVVDIYGRKAGSDITVKPDATVIRANEGKSSLSVGHGVSIAAGSASMAVDGSNTYLRNGTSKIRTTPTTASVEAGSNTVSVDSTQVTITATSGGTMRSLVVKGDKVLLTETGEEDIDLAAAYRAKWTNIPLGSGWTTPNHGYTPRYARIGKRMYFAGRVSRVGGGNFVPGETYLLATFNGTDRPAQSTAGVGTVSGFATVGFARIELQPSGDFYFAVSKNTSWVGLDGYFFDTE